MPEHTYRKQCGWKNSGRLPVRDEYEEAGHIYDWLTQGGIPIMVPDQWVDEDPDAGVKYAPLPVGIEARRITDGVVVTVTEGDFHTERGADEVIDVG